MIAKNNPKSTIIITNTNTDKDQYLQSARSIQGLSDSCGEIETETQNSRKIIIGSWQKFQNAQWAGMIDMKEYALMCVDEADVNGLSENRQTALEKLSTEDNTVIL